MVATKRMSPFQCWQADCLLVCSDAPHCDTPDEGMIADCSKLHQSIIDLLQGLGPICTVVCKYLTLNEVTEGQLIG